MGYAVKYQADLLKGKMRPGDVIVSNHPEGPSDMTSSLRSRLTDNSLFTAGGTHLPDITVICPGTTVCQRLSARLR